jgi:hypothetical protein
MIKITLEDINWKSPYEVTLNNGDFDFLQANGRIAYRRKAIDSHSHEESSLGEPGHIEYQDS